MRPERQHRPRPTPTPSAQRQRAVRWLRCSYRAGAIVDAAAAVGMAVPARLWPVRFAPSFRRDREFTYGMGAGAALMAGWTLLLWADRRPLQRKGVLPLTMLVIGGLLANDRRARRAGLTTARDLAPGDSAEPPHTARTRLARHGWCFRAACRPRPRLRTPGCRRRGGPRRRPPPPAG